MQRYIDTGIYICIYLVGTDISNNRNTDADRNTNTDTVIHGHVGTYIGAD